MSASPEQQQIIVADDDKDDFFAFQIACEDLSYKVLLVHVTNTKSLLDHLERELPDILFLDIMLPPISGSDCLRQLRSNRKYDQLPIIMYTSMSDLNNIEFCFREGANLYVIKPATFKGIKDVIERILTINWKATMYYPTRGSFVIDIE